MVEFFSVIVGNTVLDQMMSDEAAARALAARYNGGHVGIVRVEATDARSLDRISAAIMAANDAEGFLIPLALPVTQPVL